MSKSMTGARMVVQALIDQGVDTVFGYPGGAVLPIYDEIFQQNSIKHVLVRHEQAHSTPDLQELASPAPPDAQQGRFSQAPGVAGPMT